MKEKIKRLTRKVCNRETISYTIVGVGTSLLNIILFKAFLMAQIEYKIANILTLIIVKLTAYICNKNLVFKSRCQNMKQLIREFLRYLVARGATALIDYFGLIVMVEFFRIDKMVSKVFTTVLVVIINYFAGKKHVFKNVDTGNEHSV